MRELAMVAGAILLGTFLAQGCGGSTEGASDDGDPEEDAGTSGASGAGGSPGSGGSAGSSSTDAGGGGSVGSGGTAGVGAMGGVGAAAGAGAVGSGGTGTGGSGGIGGVDADAGGLAGGPPLCSTDGGCPSRPWDDSIEIADATYELSWPVGVVWDDGRALVAWAAEDENLYDEPVMSRIFWSQYEAGAWSAPAMLQEFGGSAHGVAIASGPDGIAHLAWCPVDYYTVRSCTVASFDSGMWTAPLILTTSNEIDGFPRIAVADSRIAVVWAESTGRHFAVVSGGAVAETGVLTTDDGFLYDVVTDGSTFLAAYEDGGEIFAREHDGRGWSSPELVFGGIARALALAMNPNAEAIALFQPVVMDGSDVLTTRLRSGGTWLEPRVVPTGQDVDASAVAIDDAGQSLVVWSSGREDTLAMAHANPDGTWPEPTLLGAGQDPISLAVATDTGQALIAWTTRNEPYFVERTEYTPGAGWTSALTTSPQTIGGAPAGDARDPYAAMSPFGKALLVWLQWPGSSCGDGGDYCAEIPSAIRAALSSD